LNWTYGLSSGTFTPIGSTGIYFAWINTSLRDSGSGSVTIRAVKDKYKVATTYVNLLVLALPSELIIESPDAVFTHYRGDPVDVVVYLIDMYNGGIRIENGVTSVYMVFNSIQYPLAVNSSGFWKGTLPTNATANLEPGRIYSVRIIADATNYDPASSIFKMDLLATATTIHLVYPTTSKNSVTYNDLITFYLSFNQSISGEFIENATISWDYAEFNIHEIFTYNPTSGLWELQFNTSRMAFGTWGLSFEGIPYDSNYAADIVDLVITIRKITTQAISPIPGQIYWGWVGNLTFYYYDVDFDTGISNATATFKWADFSGNATPLGGGWYSILIDTNHQ
jgi:hypothetical protein